MRNLVLALVVCGAVGCTNDLALIEAAREDHAEMVVLEGDALTAELTESPERQAPVPFSRLGLLWDAPADATLEFSVSVDGQTWTGWAPVKVHHVEAEETNSYVGELEVAEPGGQANFYRVRSSGAGVPSFAVVQFLEQRLADVAESVGEDELADDSFGSDLGSLAQELTIGGVTVNSRASWGARAPRCRTATSPSRFTIHHTVTPTNDSMSPQSRLRQLQAFHMDARGYCDLGYNYLVSRDGRLWEARGATTLGAHAGGANGGNVGISFIGTYTSVTATNTQLNSTAGLIKGLGAKYGIKPSSTTVKGHRQVGTTSTECPGNSLFPQIGTIIARTSTPQPPTNHGTTVKGLVYKGTNSAVRIGGATVKLGAKSATTDATGYYEFKGISAGTHTVTVSKAGYVTASKSAKVSGTETWASVGLNPAPTAGGSVKGVVYVGTDTSKRIAGATVKLGTRTTTTGADGVYTFTNVPAGTYTITAAAAGFATATFTRPVSGSVTWGSVGLSRVATGTARLVGVVYKGTDASNRVGGATVKLSNGLQVTADADGFYELKNLAPGTYSVTATKSGVGSASVSRSITNGTTTWGSISL